MATRLETVLRANALFDVAAGLLLLTGTWDGLWRTLDLPQGRPAIFVQIGGAALLGFGYAQWRAAGTPTLRSPVALAAALADGVAALVVITWLASGKLVGIGVLGNTLLVLITVILIAFTVLKVLGGRGGDRSGAER